MRNAYLQQQCDYSSRFRILKGGKISLVVSALIAGSTMSFAAPSGGVLNSGSATITQNGSVTTINQSTQRASINWQSFSIASNETVNFNQPNSSAVTLNRVVGNEKSIIDGALNANGQVWILNSNGLLFGQGASVNTAGLVASTMNMSDAAFMNGGTTFESTGSTASVINTGTIRVTDGAYVALLGKEVANEGLIQATKGTVALAAGDKITLNFNGNSLVGIAIDQGTLGALVENKGAIIADGGKIFLTTKAANDLLSGAVNNTGLLQANSIDGITGHIEVFAHGGTANVGGTIQAQGGFVETSGKVFAIQPNATIKAGEWLIDPVNITIDSTLAGTIQTALGSGDVTITTDGSNTPDTLSGESGTNGDITVNSDISWNNANSLTLSAARNIYINSLIEAAGDGTLVLNYGQGAAAAGNTASYTFGNDSEAGTSGFAGNIILSGTSHFQTKLGADGTPIDWTIITSLGAQGDELVGADTLQGIGHASKLGGNYVLGGDIYAADTGWGWNEGSGFKAIGDANAPFTGKFDGLGHSINNLFINRPIEDNIGLFGYSGGTIRNVALLGVDITGNSHTGGLVGYNGGVISHAHISDYSGDGSFVHGLGYETGGLVGWNGGGAISDSFAHVSATGDAAETGGLVGLVSTGGSIVNSWAEGGVQGTVDVGGLVGSIDGGTVSNSYAVVDVTAVGAGVGVHIGGLVGSVIGGSSSISDSYAAGRVIGNDYVGGLVGAHDAGTITRTYSTGQVVSEGTHVGGLFGSAIESVSNSFWDIETSGKAASAAGTGKTTAQMSDIATFTATGWDIAAANGTNDPYPSLTMGNGVTVWTIPVVTPPPGGDTPPPGGDTPPPSNDPEPEHTPTADTDTEDVITAIVNTNTVHVEAPEHFEVKVEAPRTITYREGREISLVSAPVEGQSVQKISMEEVSALQKPAQSSDGSSSASAVQETRVALYQDSVVDLVNGGVSLPEGVHQEFYVVKNDAPSNTNITAIKEAN